MLAGGGADEARILVDHLEVGTSHYDFVLIDCPPSVGHLTQTALAASSEVFMPIQCEYFAMEGLTQMIEVIRGVMQARPGKLSFALRRATSLVWRGGGAGAGAQNRIREAATKTSHRPRAPGPVSLFACLPRACRTGASGALPRKLLIYRLAPFRRPLAGCLQTNQ